MKPPTDTAARLTRIGALAGEQVDLAETALVLASIERPGVRAEPYRRHLDRLAGEIGDYAGEQGADKSKDLHMQAEALCQVIARRYGYAGTDEVYDDHDGANLMGAIDRRTGLPVVLGIIYIHAARSLGWTIDGLDFPARFLVRLCGGKKRIILDPFAYGRILGPKEMRELSKAAAGNHAELTLAHFKAMDNRQILLRAQNHIKVRLLRADRLDDALEAIETMLLFAPAAAELWREAGLLNARLDKVTAAVAALEEFLLHNTGDSARFRTSILLQELRGRIS